MPDALPAITGKQLIRLFRRDGWREEGRRTHGISFSKVDGTGRKRITLIPDKRSNLPPGTLGSILGPLQSCMGRDGLLAMIARHGLR